MDLVHIQKEIAKEVLEELEVIDPHCILAGGAPRDWFFGKPAADLDFYVYDAQGLSQSTWIERLDKTLLDVEALGKVASEETCCDEYTSMDNLKYVFEGEYSGVKVQVMVMSEPTFFSVVDNFCADNSKIWWKGDGVIPTFDFLLAFATRTFRVCDEHRPKDRYLEKMSEKFPHLALTLTDTEYEGRVAKFLAVEATTEKLKLVQKWCDITDKIDWEAVRKPCYLCYEG